MLNVQIMIQDAEKCLGWPYVSPGTNDQNGIDCSGLFVRIFREQGAKIAHGSNTIYRNYCSQKGLIGSAYDLVPGMAVFKWNPNTPEKFKDDLGDFQHIGLVISGSPLKIIHASSAAGRVVIDEKLGKWKYWGMLKNVDYGQEEPGSSEPVDIPAGLARVEANGDYVKMRYRPDNVCTLYDNVPVGSIVEVKEYGNVWSKISYGRRSDWYMMTQFLVPIGEETDEPEQDEEPTDIPSEPVEIRLATVVSENGKSVKMRKEPSTACGMYDKVPYGATVAVEEVGEVWSKISYGIRNGWYMMTKFLRMEENGYG